MLDRHAQQEALALGHCVEDVGLQLAQDLATAAAGSHDACRPKARNVPRDQRLAESDGVDQIADRGRALGKSPDDPEAVHVRERLVEYPQLPQIVRLIDDRGNGGADMGGGGQGGDGLLAGGRKSGSTPGISGGHAVHKRAFI